MLGGVFTRNFSCNLLRTCYSRVCHRVSYRNYLSPTTVTVVLLAFWTLLKAFENLDQLSRLLALWRTSEDEIVKEGRVLWLRYMGEDAMGQMRM